MKYEYNGHLTVEERIDQVSKEITEYYPQVTLEKAKEAAIIEDRISSEVTLINKLNRLYNIMLVHRDNKKIVMEIFKDYLKLISNNNTDYGEELDKYVDLIDGINTYLYNNADFPFINHF